jgi:hypothetical protein
MCVPVMEQVRHALLPEAQKSSLIECPQPETVFWVQLPGQIRITREGITFMIERASIKPEQFFGVQSFTSMADLNVRLFGPPHHWIPPCMWVVHCVCPHEARVGPHPVTHARCNSYALHLQPARTAPCTTVLRMLCTPPCHGHALALVWDHARQRVMPTDPQACNATVQSASLPIGTETGASKPSWWAGIFPVALNPSTPAAANSPTWTSDAVHAASLPRDHSGRTSPTAGAAVWQSKPAVSPTGAPSFTGSPHVLPGFVRTSVDAGVPTAPPSTRSTPTLADGIAAGFQESLSSISQFTGYIQNNLKRQAWNPDAFPEGAVVTDAPTTQRMGRSPMSPRQQSPLSVAEGVRSSGASVPQSEWGSEKGAGAGGVEGAEGQGSSVWQILWKDGETLRKLPFRSSSDTRARIQDMVCLDMFF